MANDTRILADQTLLLLIQKLTIRKTREMQISASIAMVKTRVKQNTKKAYRNNIKDNCKCKLLHKKKTRTIMTIFRMQ